MTPAQTRRLLRLAHLLLAAVATLALYLPLIDATTARVVVGITIPLLAASGVGLWQQAKLRKLLVSRRVATT